MPKTISVIDGKLLVRMVAIVYVFFSFYVVSHSFSSQFCVDSILKLISLLNST